MSESLFQSFGESAEMARACELLDGDTVPPGGVSIGGFWGGAVSFFLACWSSRSAGSRDPAAIFIVTASQEESDELIEELETFAPSHVRSFPAWESLFLEELVQ